MDYGEVADIYKPSVSFFQARYNMRLTPPFLIRPVCEAAECLASSYGFGPRGQFPELASVWNDKCARYPVGAVNWLCWGVSEFFG